MDEPLIEQSGDDLYRLTKAGLLYITEMLEEEGFFMESDTEGFEPTALWAGIMGTLMVEAAHKYMESRRGEKLDEDGEAELALVALYASVAEAEVKKSLGLAE